MSRNLQTEHGAKRERAAAETRSLPLPSSRFPGPEGFCLRRGRRRAKPSLFRSETVQERRKYCRDVPTKLPYLSDILVVNSCRSPLSYTFIQTHSPHHLSKMVTTELRTGIDCLSVRANVVRFVEIPFAGQLILLASDILTAFQRVRNNSKGLRRLEDDIRNLIVAESLEKLKSVLEDIKDFVKGKSSRNVFRRLLASAEDESKIKECRDQIRQALDLFGVKGFINLDQKMERIGRILKQWDRILKRWDWEGLDVCRHSSRSVPSDSVDR
ncbi:hypothetical protein B0H12DRAFT_447496 [Mycena haematopus]|nr:hypothetical protein B0H12DRAFT_447496 [Mycena haematopus]